MKGNSSNSTSVYSLRFFIFRALVLLCYPLAVSNVLVLVLFVRTIFVQANDSNLQSGEANPVTMKD